MKILPMLVATALLLAGCAAYPSSSQRVQIEGEDTLAVKGDLARRVLVALPEAWVQAQVRQRFPQLSAEDVSHVHLRITRVELDSPEVLAKVNNNRVQLVVVVEETPALRPVASQVEEFVASLLRDELRRQGGR